MKLSVVILNYNVCYFLELCLKSVMAAVKNLDAEIIVVDNKSQDGSCEMVKRLFPEVMLIENDENYGFSKGNNLGVAQASGDYICILNPDTVVAEDTFEKVLAYADKQSHMGILGCQLIDGCGRFLPESKRNMPTPEISIKKILGIANAYYAHQLQAFEVGEVAVLVGAFMVLKKKIYDEVGGFDEDYFMYGEDIDLSYKVLKAGYKNVYFGDTSVIHFKGESTLKDHTYAKRFYGAMQIFYNKHYKNNVFFNGLVWVGIKFSQLLHKSAEAPLNTIEKRVLLSLHKESPLKLPFAVEVVDCLDHLKKNTQIIFDGNAFSHKAIIQKMKNMNVSHHFTFRILPQNAHFIIGSDSSQQRGEVILVGNQNEHIHHK